MKKILLLVLALGAAGCECVEVEDNRKYRYSPDEKTGSDTMSPDEFFQKDKDHKWESL